MTTTRSFALALVASVLFFSLLQAALYADDSAEMPKPPRGLETTIREQVKLPSPKLEGTVSVEQAIKSRRTVRRFSNKPLTLAQLSQLVWAAQGITDDAHRFKRAAPSAGALYPLEIYVCCGDKSVNGVKAGVWLYKASRHTLYAQSPKDVRKTIAQFSYNQMWAAEAPVTIAIVCEYSRTSKKYGNRAEKYVHYEAGNVSQNIFLECEALGLSAGIIGAFSDDELSSALSLPKEFEPLLVMPVGYKRGD